MKGAARDAILFKERTGHEWVRSATVTNCYKCNEKFGIILRKHHCRVCGYVFCRHCCPKSKNSENRTCVTCDTSVKKEPVCFVCNQSNANILSNLNTMDASLTYHSTCLLCLVCNQPLHEVYSFPPSLYCLNHFNDTQCSKCEKCGYYKYPTLDVQHVNCSSIGYSYCYGDECSYCSKSDTISYGPSSSQYIRLSLPQMPLTQEQSSVKLPVAVIIHGGFWKAKYGIHNAAIDSLRPFFLSKSIAVCEVEYRRVGGSDDEAGGYPETNHDILAAVNCMYDQLECIENVDLENIFLIGHSAGGCLALWLCSHAHVHSLKFMPSACIALSPVCDLLSGHERRLSDDGDAIEKYMKGTPATVHEAYLEASPAEILPLQVPTLLFAGALDTDVPMDMVEDYYWKAKRIAGEKFSSWKIKHERTLPVELAGSNQSLLSLGSSDRAKSFATAIPLKFIKLNCDHYDMVNAESAAWAQIYDELSDQVMPIEISSDTTSPRNNQNHDATMPSFHLFNNYPPQPSVDTISHHESPPAVLNRKSRSPSSDSEHDSEGSDGPQPCISPVTVPSEVENDRNTTSDQMELFSFPAPKSKRKSYAKSFFG